MRKWMAVLLALTLVLSLSACKKKGTESSSEESKSPAPVENEETAEPAPKLEPAKPVTVNAQVEEDRIPGGEYYLPEELTPMNVWLSEGSIALLAQQDDVSFYGVEGKESTPALFCWGESQAEFDWWYVTPRAIEPELWVYDIDEDGAVETVIDCYAGSGTGVSLEYIYVVEKNEYDELTSYCLPWEDLCDGINAQLQLLTMNGGTYAVLGREMLDISAEVGESDTEKMNAAVGYIAHYERGEQGLDCTFGVIAEGGEAPLLYVGLVEGTLHYKDGVYTLDNLHLRGY